MTLSRRSFLAETGAITRLAASAGPTFAAAPRVKAIGFDGFPVFDPRPVFKLVAAECPEQGDALRVAWFNKIFAYTWLMTSGAQYVPFTEVMRRALRVTCADFKTELDPAVEARIIEAINNLPVWPDGKEGLVQLRDAGVRLAFLSNMT